ncbi:hypothetical protein BJV77DRAFT_1011592 [Russula vinacea]|nr:hypothetical protein BJV77DRAFT_1011592 [Russula vinacea]
MLGHYVKATLLIPAVALPPHSLRRLLAMSQSESDNGIAHLVLPCCVPLAQIVGSAYWLLEWLEVSGEYEYPTLVERVLLLHGRGCWPSFVALRSGHSSLSRCTFIRRERPWTPRARLLCALPPSGRSFLHLSGSLQIKRPCFRASSQL